MGRMSFKSDARYLRLARFVLVVALVVGLMPVVPKAAYAAGLELDIAKGSIEFKWRNGHWEYKQGAADFTELTGNTASSPVVLMGSAIGSEANTVLVDGSGDIDMDDDDKRLFLELDGLDIVNDQYNMLLPSPVHITGGAHAVVNTAAGSSNRLEVGLERGSGYPALWVGRESAVTLGGSGALEAKTSSKGAGIGSACVSAIPAGAKNGFGRINIVGGTIVASSPYGAGIGGGAGSLPAIPDDDHAGEIVISGGSVTATGGVIDGDQVYTKRGGAGIGCGFEGYLPKITITGGIVKATGLEGGAGIGCGYAGLSGAEPQFFYEATKTREDLRDRITIAGGSVRAVSDAGGAGIGGGRGSSFHREPTGELIGITITGGEVTAQGSGLGAGLGGSAVSDFIGARAGYITITGGVVRAYGGERGSGIGGGAVKLEEPGSLGGDAFLTIGGVNGSWPYVTALMGADCNGYDIGTTVPVGDTRILSGSVYCLSPGREFSVHNPPRDASGNILYCVGIPLTKGGQPLTGGLDVKTLGHRLNSVLAKTTTDAREHGDSAQYAAYVYLPFGDYPSERSDTYITVGEHEDGIASVQKRQSPDKEAKQNIVYWANMLDVAEGDIKFSYNAGAWEYSQAGGQSVPLESNGHDNRAELFGITKKHTVTVDGTGSGASPLYLALNGLEIELGQEGKPFVVAGKAVVDVALTKDSTSRLIASGYTASAGLELPEDNSLIISGEGMLEATGKGPAAGIGGSPDMAGGDVDIRGGNVFAKGGYGFPLAGAGIGGGSGKDGGAYSQSGGTVVATGGEYAGYGADGIGGGFDTGTKGTGGPLRITGGNLQATGCFRGISTSGGAVSDSPTIVARATQSGGAGIAVFEGALALGIEGGSITATGTKGGSDGGAMLAYGEADLTLSEGLSPTDMIVNDASGKDYARALEGATGVYETVRITCTGVETAPSAPQYLIATNTGRRVDLTWEAPKITSGKPIQYYEVYMAGRSGWTNVGLNKSFSVDNLEMSRRYNFQVRAVSELGAGQGADTSHVLETTKIATASVGDIALPIPWASPQSAASMKGSGNFAIQSVTWDPLPAGGFFASSTVYTATIKLYADYCYSFDNGIVPTVDRGRIVECTLSESYPARNTITLEVEFPETPAAAEDSIMLSQEGELVFMTATEGYDREIRKITVYNTGSNGTGQLSVSLSGADAGSFEVSATSLPTIASGGSATFDVAPKENLGFGEYSATVTVETAGTALVSASFPVRFLVKRFAPVSDISDVPSIATAGVPLTLTGKVAPLVATNQRIEWIVVEAGETGAQIAGDILTASAAGEATVRATISKGKSQTEDYTKDFTITVNAAPTEVPDITSSAEAEFSEGKAGYFPVAASNVTAGFVLVGDLPPGVLFDTSTGKLYGAPVVGSAGVYEFTLHAINAVGASQAQDFSLVVTKAEEEEVAFNALQVGGQDKTKTTSSISVTFDKPVEGLTVQHVTLTGASISSVKATNAGKTTWNIALSSISVGNGATVGFSIEDFANHRFVSGHQEVTVYRELVKAEAPTTAIFDGATMMLSGVGAAMAYSLDGGATYADCGGTSVDLSSAVDLVIEEGILVITKGDNYTTYDSDPQCVVVTRASAPANVRATDETAENARDGELTKVSSAMEYRLSTESDWVSIADTTVTGLAPGTYLIRMKGGENTLPSATVSRTIAPYSPSVIPVTYRVFVSSTGEGATGGGLYEHRDTVEVYAGTPSTDMRFKKWTSDVPVAFDDADSAATSFVMPDEPVIVSAEFERIALDVTGVVITPQAVTVAPGTSYRFSAVVISNGGISSQQVEWKKQGGSDATFISEDGTLTVDDAETADTISVSASAGGVTSQAEVTVGTPLENPTVEEVTVTPASIILNRNEIFAFSATVTGENEPSQNVEWIVTGGDSEKTKIDPDTGVLSIGADEASPTLTVTATSTYADKSGTATITILQPPAPPVLVEGIALSGAGGATEITAKGGTLQLISAIAPGDAADQTVAWSIVSGSEFATISEDGLLTALADGNVVVRARAKDGSGVYEEIAIGISGQKDRTYSLTVVNGIDKTNAGPYVQGARISLVADEAPEGYVFEKWSSSAGGAFDDERAAAATFTMPGNDVIVMASYRAADDDFTQRTLTDSGSGISVSGMFSSDASLSVSEAVLHEPGTCPTCDEIRAKRTAGELIVLYEIAIEGAYKGGLLIEIVVGDQYEGQVVTVLHCNNGQHDSRKLTVRNGAIKDTFEGLSPFAVVKPQSDVPAIDSPVPADGASKADGLARTGDAQSAVAGIMGSAIAGMVICVVVLRHRKHRAKS